MKERGPERLEATAERYRLLFRHLPVGIVHFDAAGVVTDCNERFAQIMGAPRERCLGFNMIRSVRDERMRAAAAAVSRGTTGRFEGEYLSALSGARLQLKAVFGPVMEADGVTPAGGIGIFEDIGDRVSAERELLEREKLFRTVIEVEPECVKLLDREGRLQLMNPSGLAMLEAESLEQLRGLSLLSLVAPEHRAAFQELGERVFRGESGTLEFELVGLGGRRIWLETRAVPLREEGGEIASLVGVTRDITERRRMEEALRVSEAEFKSLFEASPVSLWLEDLSAVKRRLDELRAGGVRDLDAHFAAHPEAAAATLTLARVLDVNQATVDLFRAPGKEALLAGIGDTFTPETLASYARGLLNLAAGESGCEIEAVFRTFGGERLHGIVKWSVVPGHEAGYGRVVVSITDITKRRLAEEALRESREHYRDLFENASDAIFILDERHRYVDVNRRALELLGSRREDLIGRSVLDFIPTEQIPRSEAAFHDLTRRGSYSGFEGRMKTKDGRWVDIEVSSSAIVRDGVFVGSRDIVRDVTERKRSEALMQSILETVDEGFLIVDPGYRIVSANRAYAAQAGLSLGEIVGRACHEVSHGRSRPCHEAGEECAVLRVFETGEPAAALHVHQDRAGCPIYVETKAFPMKDATGAVTAAIEIVNDVTEKRRLEDQLRHAQKMEAVGLLAGGVAHDFNNILTAIIGYGNLMEMKLPVEHPVRPYADQILAAATRAATLTQSLLAFSRKQVVNPRPVDVNDVIGTVENLLRRVIGEDVRLVVDRSPGALTVLADPSQVEQVLMNLATNARDAMPAGGSLTIRTGVETPDEAFRREHGMPGEGPWAVIGISDTGTGMDDRTRERIFEPFFTTKELGRGTGLGLAIVYGIVRQSRGHISVASAPGKGTTFTVHLPLVAPGVAGEAPAPGSLRTQPGGSGAILVAEDDATLRDLMRTVLAEFGYTVVDARDGEEALRVHAEHRDEIQLAILDVIMPGKNGREVFEILRAGRPGLKVLFTSGYSGDIIDEGLLRQEGCDFLPKPVSPADLLSRIAKLLA